MPRPSSMNTETRFSRSGLVAESDDNEIYGLNVGTYEEGLQYVGRPTEVRFSELPVNEAMVRQFVGAVHDANPLYWDPELATRLCGSPVAPPATLVIWTTAQNWTPAKEPGPAPALIVNVPVQG